MAPKWRLNGEINRSPRGAILAPFVGWRQNDAKMAPEWRNKRFVSPFWRHIADGAILAPLHVTIDVMLEFAFATWRHNGAMDVLVEQNLFHDVAPKWRHVAMRT